MIDYENMVIERQYSKYPVGLKHFAKDEIFENALFDIDLISHKLTGVLKGQDYEEAHLQNGTKTEENEKEIL